MMRLDVFTYQSFILRDWTGRKKTNDSQALASYLQ